MIVGVLRPKAHPPRGRRFPLRPPLKKISVMRSFCFIIHHSVWYRTICLSRGRAGEGVWIRWGWQWVIIVVYWLQCIKWWVPYPFLDQQKSPFWGFFCIYDIIWTAERLESITRRTGHHLIHGWSILLWMWFNSAALRHSRRSHARSFCFFVI